MTDIITFFTLLRKRGNLSRFCFAAIFLIFFNRINHCFFGAVVLRFFPLFAANGTTPTKRKAASQESEDQPPPARKEGKSLVWGINFVFSRRGARHQGMFEEYSSELP